jgi:T-complex protein 1 subunit gamma
MSVSSFIENCPAMSCNGCLQELALDAVQTVARDVGGGQREVDVKNYAKIEKIPGGTIEDCKVRSSSSSRASCCVLRM